MTRIVKNERKRSKRVRGRCNYGMVRDVTLLALKMEKGGKNQGMWAASES